MSNLKSESFNIEEVKILVQLPKDSVQSKVTTNHGSVKFNSSTKELTWDIGKFSKNSSPSASGKIVLSNKNDQEAPSSVQFKFRIPSSAYSGVKVDQVNITKVDYKPYKGVRYVTIASDYQIRTC